MESKNASDVSSTSNANSYPYVPIIPEKKIHFQGLFLKHLFLDKDFITAPNLIYYLKTGFLKKIIKIWNYYSNMHWKTGKMKYNEYNKVKKKGGNYVM